MEDHVKYDAQDRWISETTGTGNRSQKFTYDTAARLEKVADTAVGGACTTRGYAYDADSNRSSLKIYPAGAGGTCSETTSPTTVSSTYDSADRITSAAGYGFTYDTVARVKTAGALLTQANYFLDDHPASLTQGGVTQNYTEDAVSRTLTRQTGASGPIETYRYTDGTDSPTWSESGTSWTRNTTGFDGNLLFTRNSGGINTGKLTNLHGDVVGELNSTNAVTWTGTYDEFGNSQATNGRQYGWLGGPQRSTESTGGLIQMGQRTYLALSAVSSKPTPSKAVRPTTTTTPTKTPSTASI